MPSAKTGPTTQHQVAASPPPHSSPQSPPSTIPHSHSPTGTQPKSNTTTRKPSSCPIHSRKHKVQVARTSIPRAGGESPPNHLWEMGGGCHRSVSARLIPCCAAQLGSCFHFRLALAYLLRLWRHGRHSPPVREAKLSLPLPIAGLKLRSELEFSVDRSEGPMDVLRYSS